MTHTEDSTSSGTTTSSELRDRRRWTKEHEALLRYLCDVGKIQSHTWYRVTPEQSHPEDDHRIMVEIGDNGSGEYVMIRYGFDSDVAKLVEVLAGAVATVDV